MNGEHTEPPRSRAAFTIPGSEPLRPAAGLVISSYNITIVFPLICFLRPKSVFFMNRLNMEGKKRASGAVQMACQHE